MRIHTSPVSFGATAAWSPVRELNAVPIHLPESVDYPISPGGEHRSIVSMEEFVDALPYSNVRNEDEASICNTTEKNSSEQSRMPPSSTANPDSNLLGLGIIDPTLLKSTSTLVSDPQGATYGKSPVLGPKIYENTRRTNLMADLTPRTQVTQKSLLNLGEAARLRQERLKARVRKASMEGNMTTSPKPLSIHNVQDLHHQNRSYPSSSPTIQYTAAEGYFPESTSTQIPVVCPIHVGSVPHSDNTHLVHQAETNFSDEVQVENPQTQVPEAEVPLEDPDSFISIKVHDHVHSPRQLDETGETTSEKEKSPAESTARAMTSSGDLYEPTLPALEDAPNNLITEDEPDVMTASKEVEPKTPEQGVEPALSTTEDEFALRTQDDDLGSKRSMDEIKPETQQAKPVAPTPTKAEHDMLMPPWTLLPPKSSDRKRTSMIERSLKTAWKKCKVFSNPHPSTIWQGPSTSPKPSENRRRPSVPRIQLSMDSLTYSLGWDSYQAFGNPVDEKAPSEERINKVADPLNNAPSSPTFEEKGEKNEADLISEISQIVTETIDPFGSGRRSCIDIATPLNIEGRLPAYNVSACSQVTDAEGEDRFGGDFEYWATRNDQYVKRSLAFIQTEVNDSPNSPTWSIDQCLNHPEIVVPRPPSPPSVIDLVEQLASMAPFPVSRDFSRSPTPSSWSSPTSPCMFTPPSTPPSRKRLSMLRSPPPTLPPSCPLPQVPEVEYPSISVFEE